MGYNTVLDLKTESRHRDEVCKEAGRKTGSKDLVKLVRVKKKMEGEEQGQEVQRQTRHKKREPSK